MTLWIPVTIAAATAQTVRFMLQKHLQSTRLSTAGSTLSRFLYSAPLVAVLIIAYAHLSGQSLPGTNTRFWAFAMVGGLCQVLATLCVVAMFRSRNFAVGLTFKSTEVLLSGLTGLILLGDRLSQGGTAAIALGFVGVVLLSDPPGVSGKWLDRVMNRAAGLGLLSGALFAVSAVGYRGASLALASGDVALRAGATLAVVTASQTLGMLGWMAWRDRAQIGAVLRAWRTAGLIGLTSMIGSFCWFYAFTLTNAAYVKTVGQIELVLALLASVLFFREKITRREVFGIAILLASILILVVSL